MLVLSRKNGQKIIINDNIEITIIEARYDNCKIAINAPKDVKIYREEVYTQIQKTNALSKSASIEELNLLKDFSEQQKKDDSVPKNKIIIKKKQQ